MAFFPDECAACSPETLYVAGSPPGLPCREVWMEEGTVGSDSGLGSHRLLPASARPTATDAWTFGHIFASYQKLSPVGTTPELTGSAACHVPSPLVALGTILENNGSNLGNVEHSVHVQYIFPIYLTIIYPPIHPPGYSSL